MLALGRSSFPGDPALTTLWAGDGDRLRRAPDFEGGAELKDFASAAFA